MPKRLRLVIYSVLLSLSLYMYYVSGQSPPPPAQQSATSPTVQIDPLRPSASLDVRRETLTSVLEKSPFNLRFDFVALADGRSRVVGRSSDGRTVLELVGPPEGVSAISLMVALPEKDALVRLRNVNAVSKVIEIALSDWAGGADWVSANIDAAFTGRGVTNQSGRKSITMSRAPQTETLVVTIIGQPL